MTCKLSLLVVVVVLFVAESKWVRISGPFSKLKEHNGWYYLQKFTFEPGYAKFDIETYVRGKGKSKSHDLYIQGIPSQNWQKEQELKCKNPVRMPLMIQQMRMTGQKDRDILQFTVNEQKDTYYFVIKDCHQMFRKDYDNDNLTFHINLRPYSNDVQIDDQPAQDTPNQSGEPEEEFRVIENQQAHFAQLEAKQKETSTEGQIQRQVNQEQTESTETVQQSNDDEIRQVEEQIPTKQAQVSQIVQDKSTKSQQL